MGHGAGGARARTGAGGPVIAALGGGEGFTSGDAAEPAIVPSGYAFSIWRVIEVLSLLWALRALQPDGPDPDLRVGLARPLTVVFAGSTLWLIAAELEPAGRRWWCSW